MAVEGNWNLTINTPMGQQQATLELKGDSGKMSAMGNDQSVENLSINGDKVSWSIDISSPMPMTLSFEGAVSGNEISGQVALGAFGESEFSGSRA